MQTIDIYNKSQVRNICLYKLKEADYTELAHQMKYDQAIRLHRDLKNDYLMKNIKVYRLVHSRPGFP
jgi:hypothetical protein